MMPYSRTTHSLLYKILAVILVLVSIGAIPAGLMFMLAPDGSLMGMHTEFLGNSIFTSFFIPGLVLFLFNGIISLICGILVWREHPQSYLMATGLGLFLIAWIFIQIIIIGFSPLLQVTFMTIGFLEIGLGLQIFRDDSKMRVNLINTA